MLFAVLISYHASDARSTFGLVRSSLDVQPFQGQKEAFDSQAEPPLLQKASYVSEGILG
jgi:hypothetical protein